MQNKKIQLFRIFYSIIEQLTIINSIVYFINKIFFSIRTYWYICCGNALKKKLKICGEGVYLNGKVTFTAPNMVELDNNVHINENAYFRTEGGLVIGENTHIARNVSIYTRNHQYFGDLLPYDSENILRPVIIGKNVWIGFGVSIIPGVCIGDGAIIGMGTVVTKDITPLSIVGNSSNFVLKSRDKQHYDKLNQSKKFSGTAGYPL